MKYLLITSSRTWRDEDTATHWLSQAHSALHGGEITLLSGNAEGGDKMCERIWEEHLHPVLRFVVNWGQPCRQECEPGHRRTNARGSEYCPAAGMYRNQEMVNYLLREMVERNAAGLCLELRDPCARKNCWDRRKGHWSHGAEGCAAMAEAAGIVTWRIPA